MNRTKFALVVMIGTALAACQKAPDQNAADANAQALEKRVATLEQQAPPTAAPASQDVAPDPAPAAPVQVDRSAPATPARTLGVIKQGQAPATASRRTAPAPRSTPAPIRQASREPVEPVVVTAPAPIEPMEPKADPAPPRETLVIPGGTELRIVLETGLSSETSQDGERVVARVERAMAQDGRVVLPGGTVLRGQVVRAESAGRVRGRSHLTVDFDRIVVRGREHPLQSTSITVDGPDGRRRDAAIIGGSTVAGAIIGGITNKGAKKGAVVGAATGAGAVLVTRGEAIEMPAGSRWTVRVTNTVRLD